jgi:hypothetical protein
VRRAAGGLGRLERNSGLLALTGLLCCSAASATASPAPALFHLTISGTATAAFDHTTAPTLTGDCQTSERSEGVRTARFRSRRPTVVRLVAGRLQAVEARGIAGTVTLTGLNTLSSVCSDGETHTPQTCARTTRSFSDARTTLLSTEPASLTLRPLRVRLRRGECPLEPAEVVAAPLGPLPGPVHLSVAALSKSRLTRLTLTASASRHRNYGPPEDGALVEQSHWRLTFERIRP